MKLLSHSIHPQPPDKTEESKEGIYEGKNHMETRWTFREKLAECRTPKAPRCLAADMLAYTERYFPTSDGVKWVLNVGSPFRLQTGFAEEKNSSRK